jgi:hypothetical protein
MKIKRSNDFYPYSRLHETDHMKRKYEKAYPDFQKVMDNGWEILRYLFQESLPLEDQDFIELGNIVKSSGDI